MGIFKDIVRNSTKKGNAFKLGFTFTGDRENVEYIVECVEKKDGLEPAIESVTIKFIDGEIVFKIENKVERGMRLASFDEDRNRYYVDVAFLDQVPLSLLLNYCTNIIERQSEDENPLVEYVLKKYKDIGRMGDLHDISVFSTSPVRSRPKRTYDPTREFK